jgi:hypothetical protein
MIVRSLRIAAVPFGESGFTAFCSIVTTALPLLSYLAEVTPGSPSACVALFPVKVFCVTPALLSDGANSGGYPPGGRFD